MQRYTKLILLLLFTSKALVAQEVLWANEVLEYSSYANDAQYSPKNRFDQILGEPSVYPQLSVSDCAWQPGGADFGEDYIKVSFAKPVRARQIAIVENTNSGSVGRIFGYGTDGEEYLLYQYAGARQTHKPRFWRVFPEEVPDVPITSVKLLIVHRLAPGIKQIDAIAISDSEEFITFDINLAEDFEKEIKKINLGSTVNSPYDEVAPIISPDGKTLFFTRINHPDNIRDPKEDKRSNSVAQDIWYAKLLDGDEWSMPLNVGPPINTPEDNAAAAFQGNSLYILNVYEQGEKLKNGLSITRQLQNGWSFPVQVKIDGYDPRKDPKSSKVNTEFSISQDREVLILGYYGLQSYGSNDLYVSFLRPDGSYSRPQNLGPIINTADKEGTPFLSADKKTLYFNSKGHPGYGDADIFMSKRLDDTWTNWSKPVNLGPEVNSRKWDGYFSIPVASEYAYLSSQSETRSDQDIFKIELSESIKPEIMSIFAGIVVDDETGDTLDVAVRMTYRDSTGSQVPFELEKDSITVEQKGILATNRDYFFQIKTTGYLPLSDSLLQQDFMNSGNVNKVFRLIPIKEGQKMVLENLFFDQGRYEIKDNSYEELEKLVEIMNDYPSMRILLEGHTDNQGDFTLNVQLAENRVNAVKDYLVGTGKIEPERIETKSWGPLKPISSNATPETRKKNRRVEFTILKM